jgi:hypothetical protein
MQGDLGSVDVPLRVINGNNLTSRVISDKLCRIIGDILGNSIRKSSRGVVCAIKYVSDSITCLLALDASPDNSGDVRVLDPRLYNERADTVHDDYRIVVLRSDSKDEVITIVPSSEIVAGWK